MRILLIHNRYLEPGGEDTVFKTEKTLLERGGHEVIPFVEDNARLNGMNPLRAALNAVWSREAQARIQRLIWERKPDVAHFHNTFLLISPAAYYACKEEGVPVVQTLHNYRLICPGSLLMRDGRVCEECVGRGVPWPGVVHGCWRGSRLQTSVVAAMLTLHRAMKTWTEQVDCYIALTEFARRKFIEGGLPEEKIVVKPNFVSDELRVTSDREVTSEIGVTSDKLQVTAERGVASYELRVTGGEEARYSSLVTRHSYALFVGRLSPEKGVGTLLRAWRWLKGVPLKIVGDGPLRAEVEEFVRRKELKEVEVLGRRPREEVFHLMGDARVLAFPSEWYETFGMAIVEAFACGLPVIASRLGAMAEIVEDGRTGLLFDPGNSEDLAAKVQWAWEHPREIEEMGREARREYEQKYTAERNYEMLMEIYSRVTVIGDCDR